MQNATSTKAVGQPLIIRELSAKEIFAKVQDELVAAREMVAVDQAKALKMIERTQKMHFQTINVQSRKLAIQAVRECTAARDFALGRI